MKKKKKVCATAGCRKEAKQGSRCYSCRIKAYKERHPIRYAYCTLRNNVKRRNKLRFKQGKPLIPFTLTYEEFKEFCYETDILHGRGRMATSYHIDRVIDELGYAKGNIQKLTNTENIQKENRRRKVIKYDYQYQLGYMLEMKPHEASDCPF